MESDSSICFDNVTTFRPRMRANSLGNLTESSHFESTRISEPYASLQISELDITANRKIMELEQRVKSANEEIDNLILQNRQIQTELDKCKKVVDMYKNIEFTDISATPLSGNKRKRKRLSIGREECHTPVKGAASQKVEHQQFVYEKQQEMIAELNNQVKELEHWLEEEKKKNFNIKKLKKAWKIRKTCKAQPKSKNKRKTVIFKKLKKETRKIMRLQKECTEVKNKNDQAHKEVLEQQSIRSQLQEKRKKAELRNEEIMGNEVAVQIANTTAKKNTKKNETSQDQKSAKKKIIILADQRGIALRKTLQDLVGTKYDVTAYWKANASIENILDSNKQELLTLTKNDYIVLLGGMNDYNPNNFKFVLNSFLSFFRYTNIIVSEVPYNRFLNEHKLNYEIRYSCMKYGHVTYLDMDYSKTVPNKNSLRVQLCKSVLRVLLQQEYKIQLLAARLRMRTERQCLVATATIGTQTEINSLRTSQVNHVNNLVTGEKVVDTSTQTDNHSNKISLGADDINKSAIGENIVTDDLPNDKNKTDNFFRD